MSGFFKKLFNRIVGKKEQAPEVVVEVPQLPAPEPEPVSVPEPKPMVAKAKPAKKPTVKKPEPKKPEPKKKAEVKKPAVKKPAVKKPEPKKVEAERKPVKPPRPLAGEVDRAPRRETERVLEPKPLSGVADAPPPLPQAGEEKITPQPEPERKGWLSRLKDGLSKSSKSLTGSITAIFTKRKLDAETLQELEDTLIQADLGIAVAERIIKAVATGRYDKEIDPQEVKQILSDEVAKVLKPVEVPFNFGSEKPFVILVVGVNGSGKTTTIGKLGSIAAREGFKVMFAACDTFRAAAIEQLTIWGKRIGAETISRPQGADAAGLAFDAMKRAHEDGTDILFIDTAGRLHNKTYLMDELDKVVRVIKKYDVAAPHAVLLVLDATTGQNALAQAEAFTKVAGVTGLIMTKLDGTARGGILVAIAEKFKMPIHAIGVGEAIEDLQPFDADAFARAIAGLDEKP
jgi:fused signal recognition particle receptor